MLMKFFAQNHSHIEILQALFLIVSVPFRMSRLRFCHFYANKLMLATPHPSHVYAAFITNEKLDPEEKEPPVQTPS